MSGECGPIAAQALVAWRPGAKADSLLERALDLLHAELASYVEANAQLKNSDGPDGYAPILESIDDATLISFAEMINLVIDIEDHLQMPASFSTANSPRWLREVIRRGRLLRERRS